MAPRAKSATPRKVKDAAHDKEFNKYCEHLERQKVRTRPEHKHERYDRIGDKDAYDKGIELAFGKRSIKDVQKRAGRTRKVFG